MKYCTLLLLVLVVLIGCKQETTDRQTAVDDLAEKVIAEKAEQKKQAEQEKEEKKQIESVGRTKAERVVEAYLLSDSAKGRARFVLDPKTALPRMEKYYEESNLSGIKVKELSRIDGEGDPKPGKYGKYRAGYINRGGYKNTAIYYVKNTRDGMKIDWEPSVGYNDMSWNGFAGLRPTEPMTFRVNAQISSTYIFEFGEAGATHYSVNMAEGHFMFGYVKKNSRLGRRLFGILKDGERHHLTLKLRFLPERQQINCAVVIDDLVSEDWLIR